MAIRSNRERKRMPGVERQTITSQQMTKDGLNSMRDVLKGQYPTVYPVISPGRWSTCTWHTHINKLYISKTPSHSRGYVESYAFNEEQFKC